jgi:hypothetical protein
MIDDDIISVHKLRFMARRKERRLQKLLDLGAPVHAEEGLPYWARGVRVQKAGRFQWAVVATVTRGH